ncbi:MAG: hypothetical protein HRU03_00690 [Nanoarchaeales archaeon]|nr:hypothetical protein [Nanoarchaeales archaeon]
MIKKTIVNSLKEKALEMGTQYFKEKFENSKDEFLKYIEQTVEKKIKKELKKIIYSTIAIILVITGVIFIVFGILAALVHITNLPDYFTPLFFGMILMSGAMITYLNK